MTGAARGLGTAFHRGETDTRGLRRTSQTVGRTWFTGVDRRGSTDIETALAQRDGRLGKICLVGAGKGLITVIVPYLRLGWKSSLRRILHWVVSAAAMISES